MTTQPEALRLADEMANYWNERGPDAEAVAAELRRLHAENEALRATLGALHYHCKFGDGLMASTIVDECERAVPKLAAIDAAKERT